MLHRIYFDYIYRKHKPKFVTDQSGGLRLIQIGQKSIRTKLLYKLFSNLYLPYFLDSRLDILKQNFGQASSKPHQKTMANSDAIGELGKKILDRAKNMALERKHRITVIAILPQKPRMELKRFCDQNGINFLQIVLPEGHDFVFGKHDFHWNPQAHKLIINQLLSQWEGRTQPTVVP